MSYRSREDEAVYAVEELAFDGTPLGDRVLYRNLIDEGTFICQDRRLFALAGNIKWEVGRASLTRAAGYAMGNRIVVAPRDIGRSLIPHEVAHHVHRASKLGGTSHGPEWRSAYVAMVSSMYGREYGDLLEEHFVEADLPLSSAQFPVLDEPVYDFPEMVRWV